jgi:hypothetical protein
MKKGYFHITQAVLNAYHFVWHEWRHLAGLAVIPLLASFVTEIATEVLRPDASPFEDFLWMIPATALSAWFMFAIIRYQLLGEKVTQLMQQGDLLYLKERHRLMQACAIVWILFNMAILSIGIFFSHISRTEDAHEHSGMVIGAMLLIGATFWGVRFSVAHLLVAIGYPVKKFIFQVDGAGISFRLIGMGLMASFPVLMVLQALLGLFLPPDLQNISGLQYAIVVVIGTTLSFVMTAILTSAAGFALREMLGAPKKGGRS